MIRGGGNHQKVTILIVVQVTHVLISHLWILKNYTFITVIYVQGATYMTVVQCHEVIDERIMAVVGIKADISR